MIRRILGRAVPRPDSDRATRTAPYETVDSSVRLTASCLDALLTQYGGMERPTVWTGLFLVPRDGSDPVRSGSLEGLSTFHLHGRGCRFELETGGLGRGLGR